MVEDDCGTTRGVEMRALVEGGEVIQALRDRVLGRVTAVDVINPDTHEVVIAAGTLLDERLCDKLDEVGIDMVKVRTPLTCDTRYGFGAPSAMAEISAAARWLTQASLSALSLRSRLVSRARS